MGTQPDPRCQESSDCKGKLNFVMKLKMSSQWRQLSPAECSPKNHPLGHFVLVGRAGQPSLQKSDSGSNADRCGAGCRVRHANLRTGTVKMTTSKNVNGQTSNWRQNNGVTALEGLREVEYIDDSSEEESYELLPSGD